MSFSWHENNWPLRSNELPKMQKMLKSALNSQFCRVHCFSIPVRINMRLVETNWDHLCGSQSLLKLLFFLIGIESNDSTSRHIVNHRYKWKFVGWAFYRLLQAFSGCCWFKIKYIEKFCTDATVQYCMIRHHMTFLVFLTYLQKLLKLRKNCCQCQPKSAVMCDWWIIWNCTVLLPIAVPALHPTTYQL